MGFESSDEEAPGSDASSSATSQSSKTPLVAMDEDGPKELSHEPIGMLCTAGTEFNVISVLLSFGMGACCKAAATRATRSSGKRKAAEEAKHQNKRRSKHMGSGGIPATGTP
jgi:hypothetical protein